MYDITIGRDTFLETTRAIAEYVGAKFETADEWRQGMVEQKLSTLRAPTPPSDSTNIALMENYKLDLREHRDALSVRKNNQGKVYALVLGQCSPALRNLMEASHLWDGIDGSSNVMSLLCLIQSSMNQRQTRKQSTHIVVEADSVVYSFKQGRRVTDAEYFNQFKDKFSTAQQLGGGVAEPFDQGVAKLSKQGIDQPSATADDITLARASVRRSTLQSCLL